MEKKVLFTVFLLLITVIGLFLSFQALFRFTGMFVGFGQPAGEFEWWNTSWHYRFRIEINASSYERNDWPIEYEINFTDLLPFGTFDENSTRVIEYSSSGLALHELPSQFDKDEEFDPSSNAMGTLVFLLNGTTQAYEKRIFYVYYDTLENGAKEKPDYPTNLSYSWDGEEFNVNTSALSFWVDTLRGENTSGLYRIRGIASQNDIGITPDTADRTMEYMEYSNGTHNFSFDFRNNATLKYSGPVRLVVEQKGYETIWDTGEKTNEGFVIKRYVFYDLNPRFAGNQWIKVETNYTNLASASIQRNSTFAGALSIDAERIFRSTWQSIFGNTSQPGWWFASDYWGSSHIGIIHLNQTGTTNFWVPNSSSKNRIGIQLNQTTIPPGSSITETAVLHFNDTSGDYNQVRDLRDRLANPVVITTFLPERWYVSIIPGTNATVYNRNESLLITGNITFGDPYNLAKYMNATLDMGTPSASDDQTIILYDDGTHGDEEAGDKVFTNFFVLSDDASVGVWTVNFTVYTNESEFLNSTTFAFNVTDALNVSVEILNKKPVVGTTVNAKVYVKNYRQDAWVAGATINCSYDSSEVVNKTDHDNGTYSVNFTAPSQEGIYTLACNATKNGNFGSNTDTFSAEPGKTNLTVEPIPSEPMVTGVTLYSNGSFEISVNVTNIGNGTAYSTNVSLELLEGWGSNATLQGCNDLEKETSCTKGFNVSVPKATSPGNYYINATVAWTNPDNSMGTNKTKINVTVASNPLVNVTQERVSGEIGDGTSDILGNFTVVSIGNDELKDINFICYSGVVCDDFIVEFIPSSISSLQAGLEKNVSVNVSVPLGYTAGTYSGTVNVSAGNDGYKSLNLEVSVPAKTYVSINTSLSVYIVKNITLSKNESFEFLANATNIGSGTAKAVNISLILPTGWSTNTSFEECGDLSKHKSCAKGFKITIPEATPPSQHFLNVSVNWTNPDNSLSSNQTRVNATVSSNPLINITQLGISGSIPDGTENVLGNFTVVSIGNDELKDINFICYSGVVCDDFIVEFIPSSISSLQAGLEKNVSVNVSVPLGYTAGTYSGTVNVSAGNDGYKSLNLEVSVPANRTWSMSPVYCQKSETPPEGKACDVNVTNLGNVYINFTITPEEGNYTKVNETNFTVNARSWHVFSVNYNVTGIPQGIYNSTFVVDALQPANPDNITLSVSLLPFVEPIIEVKISPNLTEQYSAIEIYANVTDRSNTGITWTRVRITDPNESTQTFSMLKTYESGNFTRWYFKYESGNTSLRGRYNVSIIAKDNVGNTGEKNSSFIIYTKLSISVSTLSEKYYQGDTGSIYYIAKDANGVGVGGINVSFKIKNSEGNTTYTSNFTTIEDGTIYPLPSFFLSSDSPLGVYTLVSESRFYEAQANMEISLEKNYTFQVLSRTVTVTGLFADIETAVVWYPDNIMKFGLLFYNGEGRPVDPDWALLKVLDPAGNAYFTANLQDMTRQTTGFYTYSYAMSSNTATGMYLATVNATQDEFETYKIKAFRVARGGPYDLFVDLLETEVYQGDYLDFAITIENKGEVSQDVLLEWWVSSGNETYYSSSGWVYTPAVSNQTITKQAYIFTSQPAGTYVLNVRMTYDNIQPPLVANATFNVVGKLPPIPPNVTLPPPPPVQLVPVALAPLPAPQITEKLPASLKIESYRSNISVARGMTIVETVVVKNDGQVDLNNVTLFIFGLPLTWFNITPETYRTLPVGETVVFRITFSVPANADEGEHEMTLTAMSGVVSDQKSAVLTVFKSIEELLRDEISKLRKELTLLQKETSKAAGEGKDVSGVLMYIDEIVVQLDLADENLKNNKTEEALKNVASARNLLDKAWDVLRKLEVPKPPPAMVPLWLILVIVFAIIFGVFVVVILILRRKKKLPAIRPFIIPVGRVAERVKKVEVKEKLVKEREKLLRMLDVLEREKKEGIISGAAYLEMKKNINKKLKEIEKKIK